MKTLPVPIVLIALLTGCARGPTLQPLGTAGNLKPAPPEFAISPERAVALAQSHLENSYQLRREYVEPDKRSEIKPPVDHVTLKGDTYYIVRGAIRRTCVLCGHGVGIGVMLALR